MLELPDSEKELLQRDLREFLLPRQRFVLGVLLGEGKVRIVSSTKGTISEVKGGWDSVDMFGPWRAEWEM